MVFLILKRIKVMGDLSKCGFSTEDLKTDLGSIKVPRVVPVKMDFSEKLSGLEALTMSRRFSIINKFYETLEGAEILSGTLVDEKTHSIFGLAMWRSGATLVPRGSNHCDPNNIIAFARLITRLWKGVNVTVTGPIEAGAPNK